MVPPLGSMQALPDGSLNPEETGPDQESMFISPSAVLEAFTTANRALESGDRFSTSTAYTGLSTAALPSNLYSTPQYGLTYPMMERLGGDVGGKWTPDEHYRRLMRMNNIPTDPGQWNEMQVGDFLPTSCHLNHHRHNVL